MLLLTTILLLISMLLPVEAFFRSDYAQDHLLAPGYGMNSSMLETQLHLLDQFEQDQGPVDCIFLGSSIVLQGINPTVVEDAYRAETGEDIQCYNFGVNGLVGQSAGLVAPIVVERYQPQLLIYGATPREFAARRVNDDNLDIIENNWVQYANGNFNWQGFLISNFATYRYYLRYQDWLSPEFEETLSRITEMEAQLTDEGQRPVFNTLYDVNIPPVPGNVERERPIFGRLTDFEPNERDIRGVEAIASLQQDTDTHVLIIEMPTHSSFIGYFNNGLEGYNTFTAAMQEVSTQYQVPFWQLRPLHLVPDEFWRDRTHTNANGALIVSDWLGSQLGRAVSMGLFDEELPQMLLDGPPAADIPVQDIAAFYNNPLGLSDADYVQYQQFDSYGYVPEGAVIFDPDDTPGDLLLYQYNIGANLDLDLRDQSRYRHLWLEFMHLLGRIQQFDDFPPDVQPLLQTWRDSGDVSALKQAGIDYLMIPSAWLMLQDDRLIDPEQLEFIREWEYPSVGPVYRMYRVK